MMEHVLICNDDMIQFGAPPGDMNICYCAWMHTEI